MEQDHQVCLSPVRSFTFNFIKKRNVANDWGVKKVMTMRKIKIEHVDCLAQFIGVLTRLETPLCVETERYFRGEPEDFREGAIIPSIYRSLSMLENEPNFYREMQRFNDQEFRDDKTAVDKLSRMQHYNAPTRLIDMSEDALSALYFAVDEGQRKEAKKYPQEDVAVVYIIDVLTKRLRYYDSDTVSVIANLAKSPLSSSLSDDTQKNKQAIASDAHKYRENIKEFNEQGSIHFLLHDLKEEKPYFSHIINPKHIFSVQCVKPKFTHSRVNSQKGAFLLFGLNPNNIHESIRLIEKCDNAECYLSVKDEIQHPIEHITKIMINGAETISKISNELRSIGVKTPFIYPEMDKVAEYLKQLYKP